MLWLLLRGQVWIVQIMLAPLVMAGLLAWSHCSVLPEFRR